jgi:hypothetical protein
MNSTGREVSMRVFAFVAVGTVLLQAVAVRGADDGPFEFVQSSLMRSTPRGVFVAFMGDYLTPAVSGNWGAWGAAGKGWKPHDPARRNSGARRDIASCFYPAIGPYDMSDPDVADYHCQLLKMTGIDGISFNVGLFQHNLWQQKSMRIYVAAMQRYGLKGIIRFENKAYAKTYPVHEEALAAACADMDAWMKLIGPIQYRIAGRPVFMLFSFKLSPKELETWKTHFPSADRPIIITYSSHAQYKGVVDGLFGWCGLEPHFLTDHLPYRAYVTPELARQNEQAERLRAADLLTSGQISVYMAGVSPGFDDIGCWGWGTGPRKVDRDDGRTYAYRWEKTLATNLQLVFIPTWNDWAEGTTIEPSVEYGDQYLRMTREYAARFKSTAASAGDFLLPIWIYKVRKTTSDAAALRDMSAASDAIAAGDYRRAESIVAPWAARLKVETIEPWDRAAAGGEATAARTAD